MREAIRALPDGVYTSEIWNNPLGTPLRYPLKITVQGDAIELDFAGAPRATAAGRPELHLQLHRGARDLSDEVHADARRCAAMPAAIGRSR